MWTNIVHNIPLGSSVCVCACVCDAWVDERERERESEFLYDSKLHEMKSHRKKRVCVCEQLRE